jgi:hypothetical protein
MQPDINSTLGEGKILFLNIIVCYCSENWIITSC